MRIMDEGMERRSRTAPTGPRSSRRGPRGGRGGPERQPADAREAALHVLTLVDAGQPLQGALDAVLDASRLAARERRLCADLAYGVCRECVRLDAIFSRLLPAPEGLPRPMRHILALGAHSLLFQARVPAHAAIFCAVEMARVRYGQRMARLANGVLRSLQRLGDAVADSAWYAGDDHSRQSADDVRWHGLCRFWSMPDAIAGLWRKAYGEDAALSLMRRSFQRPWTGLRVNAAFPEAMALRESLVAQAQPGQWEALGAWGLAFAPGAVPQIALGHELDHWRRRGALAFQAAGSQRVLLELGLEQWDAPVWDACAGFGGKSVALAEWGCQVALATDTSGKRLALLRPHFDARALVPPLVALADAARPPMRAWAGNILADVPCSGLGVLGRRPDIRCAMLRNRSVQHFAAEQRRILRALSGCLQPGRALAYITCTLNPLENEETVAWLLKQDAGLRLVREWMTPHDHPWLEGMYGAVFRRKAPRRPVPAPRPQRSRIKPL